MKSLFVAEGRSGRPLSVPGVDFAATEKYLTDPGYNEGRYQRIVNRCSCDRQQG